MAKKNRIAEAILQYDTSVVQLRWADGKTDNFPVAKLTGEIRAALATRGLREVLGDSYNTAENLAEARFYADRRWNYLTQGIWDAPRISFLLVEALQRLRPMQFTSDPQTIEFLGRLTEEQIVALRGQPEVKATILALQAERTARKADTTPAASLDDLLGGIQEKSHE